MAFGRGFLENIADVNEAEKIKDEKYQDLVTALEFRGKEKQQDFEDIKIKRKEKKATNAFLKMDDGRYVFFSKDKDNVISLIVEDGSNVTVNYDNRGSIINAKMNSGNNVQFNIKQQ